MLTLQGLAGWPGTESNRRRQPFQGWYINNLQAWLTESKRLTCRRFGLHLDARAVLDSTGTPHIAMTSQPLLEYLLFTRARAPIRPPECLVEDNLVDRRRVLY